METRIYTILKKVPIIQLLTEEELEYLWSYMNVVVKSKDAIVFQEGTGGDSLYIILSGKVDIIKNYAKDTERILTTLKTGAVFGEMGIIEGTRRSATVKAATDCEFLALRRLDFDSISRTNSRIAFKLILELAKRMSQHLRKFDEKYLSSEESPFGRE